MTRCPSVNVSFVAIGRLACTMALSRVKVRLHFSLITFFNENHLGCKGFFKRSICNRRVYRCSRDKQCMMSRKQRNRCQYCRLRKCLEQGMNRKGKLYLFLHEITHRFSNPRGWHARRAEQVNWTSHTQRGRDRARVERSRV